MVYEKMPLNLVKVGKFSRVTCSPRLRLVHKPHSRAKSLFQNLWHDILFCMIRSWQVHIMVGSSGRRSLKPAFHLSYYFSQINIPLSLMVFCKIINWKISLSNTFIVTFNNNMYQVYFLFYMWRMNFYCHVKNVESNILHASREATTEE